MLVTCVLFFVQFIASQPTEHFVKTGGADSGTCTDRESPCATLPHLLGQSFTGPITVIILGDTYQISSPVNVGSLTDIEITSDNPELVISWEKSLDTLFNLSSCTAFAFTRLTFHNADDDTIRAKPLISATGSDNLRISNCTVKNVNGPVFLVEDSENLTLTKIKTFGCIYQFTPAPAESTELSNEIGAGGEGLSLTVRNVKGKVLLTDITLDENCFVVPQPASAGSSAAVAEGDPETIIADIFLLGCDAVESTGTFSFFKGSFDGKNEEGSPRTAAISVVNCTDVSFTHLNVTNSEGQLLRVENAATVTMGELQLYRVASNSTNDDSAAVNLTQCATVTVANLTVEHTKGPMFYVNGSSVSCTITNATYFDTSMVAEGNYAYGTLTLAQCESVSLPNTTAIEALGALIDLMDTTTVAIGTVTGLWVTEASYYSQNLISASGGEEITVERLTMNDSSLTPLAVHHFTTATVGDIIVRVVGILPFHGFFFNDVTTVTMTGAVVMSWFEGYAVRAVDCGTVKFPPITLSNYTSQSDGAVETRNCTSVELASVTSETSSSAISSFRNCTTLVVNGHSVKKTARLNLRSGTTLTDCGDVTLRNFEYANTNGSLLLADNVRALTLENFHVSEEEYRPESTDALITLKIGVSLSVTNFTFAGTSFDCWQLLLVSSKHSAPTIVFTDVALANHRTVYLDPLINISLTPQTQAAQVAEGAVNEGNEEKVVLTLTNFTVTNCSLYSNRAATHPVVTLAFHDPTPAPTPTATPSTSSSFAALSANPTTTTPVCLIDSSTFLRCSNAPLAVSGPGILELRRSVFQGNRLLNWQNTSAAVNIVAHNTTLRVTKEGANLFYALGDAERRQANDKWAALDVDKATFDRSGTGIEISPGTPVETHKWRYVTRVARRSLPVLPSHLFVSSPSFVEAAVSKFWGLLLITNSSTHPHPRFPAPPPPESNGTDTVCSVIPAATEGEPPVAMCIALIAPTSNAPEHKGQAEYSIEVDIPLKDPFPLSPAPSQVFLAASADHYHWTPLHTVDIRVFGAWYEVVGIVGGVVVVIGIVVAIVMVCCCLRRRRDQKRFEKEHIDNPLLK